MIIIANNGIKKTKEVKEQLKQGLNSGKKKAHANRFYWDGNEWWANGNEELKQFALNLGLSVEIYSDFIHKGGVLIEKIEQGEKKEYGGGCSGYYRPDCDSDPDCGGYQSYRV